MRCLQNSGLDDLIGRRANRRTEIYLDFNTATRPSNSA